MQQFSQPAQQLVQQPMNMPNPGILPGGPMQMPEPNVLPMGGVQPMGGPMQMPEPNVPPMGGMSSMVGQMPMPQPEVPVMPGIGVGQVPIPMPQPGMQPMQGVGPIPMPQPSIPGMPIGPQSVGFAGPAPAMPLSRSRTSSSSGSRSRTGSSYSSRSITPPPVSMPMPVPNVTNFNAIPPPVPMSANDPLNRDPLVSNPLPTPPRESEIPSHLLSGTAMTQLSTRVPDTQPYVPEVPLARPLPPGPRDVYDSPEYRDLTVGNAYAHAVPHGHRHRHHGRENSAPADLGLSRVYPEDWFDGKGGNHRSDYRQNGYEEREGIAGGLGRALSRLRPRRRRGEASEPLEYGYEVVGGGGQQYPQGNGAPAGFVPVPGGGQPNVVPAMQMPEPQVQPQMQVAPDLAYPVEARGEPILIASGTLYSGLRLSSPHRVLFKNRLYPTAAHLLVLFILQRLLGVSPTHAFGGRSKIGNVFGSFIHGAERDGGELATQVREAEGIGELRSVVEGVLARVGSRVVALGGDERPAMLEDVSTFS